MGDYEKENTIPALPEKWNEWILVEKIGEGAYGCVYRASRQVGSDVFYSAIKVINIPNEESEKNEMMRALSGVESVKAYYKDIVDGYIREIHAMEKLKGITNIVSIQDYEVVSDPENIRWIIYIRMELLSPFTQYQVTHKMDEEEVVRLGIDICNALEYCEKINVIHRDIKPDNIFVSELDNFKLGDFGIARMMDRSVSVFSSKGTFSFMAPEVFKGEPYDHRADIYSLGLVLYRLLNNNREPFLPVDRQMIYYRDREEGLHKRLSGESIEAPVNASPMMSEVILKALAFKKDDRFSSAVEMKRALNIVRQHKEEPEEIQSVNFSGKSFIWGIAAALIIAGIIIALVASKKFSSPKGNGTTVLQVNGRITETSYASAQTDVTDNMKETPVEEEYETETGISDETVKESVVLAETETELEIIHETMTEEKDQEPVSGKSQLKEIDVSAFAGFVLMKGEKKIYIWKNGKKLKEAVLEATGLSEDDETVEKIVELFDKQLKPNIDGKDLKSGDAVAVEFTPTKEYEELLDTSGIRLIFTKETQMYAE